MDTQLAVNQADASEPSREEKRLSGTRISPGLAIGVAWVSGDIMECSAGQSVPIDQDRIEAEIERIHRAFLEVRTELEESARRISEQLDPKLAEIFHAHQLMLDSVLSSNEFETELRNSLVGAEQTVRSVFRRWEARFAALENEAFRVRADDILDLARRVLRRLAGTDAYAVLTMPPGSVLVAQRLLPSDVVSLSRRNVAAILVESLGQGSHAALLTREKSIPAVAEIPELLSHIQNGDQLLVDASGGVVIVSPSLETKQTFEKRLDSHLVAVSRCKGDCQLPAITRDGHAVSVEANLGIYDDVDLVIENGADGIGLFRIEQLYLASELPPSEDELYEQLQALVSPLHDRLVTIRLLDLGGDKPMPALHLRPEANPLLGKRGVRLLLAFPQLVKTQLRALLRLAATQPLRILVPMIALERDMQTMRELFTAVVREMGHERPPPFGAMIETPAAALTVADIARHADFLCVGTNDLTQYTLAAARDDATVGEYYIDDHPALLRLLGIIIQEALETPVTICGELGGREEVIPTLLQLGFRRLSIAPSLIPETKQLIRSVSLSQFAGESSFVGGS